MWVFLESKSTLSINQSLQLMLAIAKNKNENNLELIFLFCLSMNFCAFSAIIPLIKKNHGMLTCVSVIFKGMLSSQK